MPEETAGRTNDLTYRPVPSAKPNRPMFTTEGEAPCAFPPAVDIHKLLFEELDWKLLSKQRLMLVGVIRNGKTTPEEDVALDGILELLDTLQEWAAQVRLFTFPEFTSD